MGEAIEKIAARLGRKGGKAKLAKYGPEAYRQMAKKRWKSASRKRSLAELVSPKGV